MPRGRGLTENGCCRHCRGLIEACFKLKTGVGSACRRGLQHLLHGWDVQQNGNAAGVLQSLFDSTATRTGQSFPLSLWESNTGVLLPCVCWALWQIRNALAGDSPGTPSIWARMGAGLLSGGIGILVANPTDVVKVRGAPWRSGPRGHRASTPRTQHPQDLFRCPLYLYAHLVA